MSSVDKLLELQLKMKRCYDTYQDVPENITTDYFGILESLSQEESEELRNKSLFL